MGGTASASWAGEELAVTHPWKPPVVTAKTTMEVGLWHPGILRISRVVGGTEWRVGFTELIGGPAHQLSNQGTLQERQKLHTWSKGCLHSTACSLTLTDVSKISSHPTMNAEEKANGRRNFLVIR